MDLMTAAAAKALMGEGGGGGSSLPEVTSSDNGKKLTVVSGDWAAAEDEFVVTFSKPGSTWSADKLLTDISEAISAKKRVYGKVAASLVTSDSTFTNQTFLLPLSAGSTSLANGYQFAEVYQAATTTLFVNVVVSLVPPLNQSVTAYTKTVTLLELPSITTPTDDYKVMTASYEGGWLKAPACTPFTYTITGQPVDGVYPLSCDDALGDIQTAINHNANVRAKLTVGADTALLSPASIGANYVTFSNIVQYNSVWCMFCVKHYTANDVETCEGYIVPLNTTVMSYNTTTDQLSITNVPEVTS